MRRIVYQNHFLEEIAQLLREGDSVRVRIDGESMHPFIIGGKDEVMLIPYDKKYPLKLWSCAFYNWRGHYMIHRFVGVQDGKYCMMGDGNLVQMERIEESEILGILQTVYHADGSTQDCLGKKWLCQGRYWFKLRKLRRFLLPLYRRFILNG